MGLMIVSKVTGRIVEHGRRRGRSGLLFSHRGIGGGLAAVALTLGVAGALVLDTASAVGTPSGMGAIRSRPPATRVVIATTLRAKRPMPAGSAASLSSGPPATLKRPTGLAGLALTPPMGWNGNHFNHQMSAALIEAEARALVASGMRANGYTYVILDGRWNLLRRNWQGGLQPNPQLFPHGIEPVVAYVHALGLKFGIYASAGLRNCAGGSAGSYGHYRQDAATFASWGVDYLKLDWCAIPYRNYPKLTHVEVGQLLAMQMGQALAATGRSIVYDVNDTSWRTDHPWTWAGHVANLWRTANDITNSYKGMLWHFVRNVGLSQSARPGGWNDPDTLEVGNGRLTVTEARSQMSLWAEMAAPLIATNNLTTMSRTARAILTNRAVIAVDQDPLGRQGYPVSNAAGHWVLSKPLAGGDRAVVLFNATGGPATISTTAAGVGLAKAATYTLHNLWTGEVSLTTGSVRALVPAHGVVMLRISVGGGNL
jgi:alpha-galactosidase